MNLEVDEPILPLVKLMLTCGRTPLAASLCELFSSRGEIGTIPADFFQEDEEIFILEDF